MPKTYDTAAKSPRAVASNRRKQLLTVGLVVIGVVIVVAILLSISSSLQIGAVGVLILLLALRFIPDLFEGYSRKKAKRSAALIVERTPKKMSLAYWLS